MRFEPSREMKISVLPEQEDQDQNEEQNRSGCNDGGNERDS